MFCFSETAWGYISRISTKLSPDRIYDRIRIAMVHLKAEGSMLIHFNVYIYSCSSSSPILTRMVQDQLDAQLAHATLKRNA